MLKCSKNFLIINVGKLCETACVTINTFLAGCSEPHPDFLRAGQHAARAWPCVVHPWPVLGLIRLIHLSHNFYNSVRTGWTRHYSGTDVYMSLQTAFGKAT